MRKERERMMGSPESASGSPQQITKSRQIRSDSAWRFGDFAKYWGDVLPYSYWGDVLPYSKVLSDLCYKGQVAVATAKEACDLNEIICDRQDQLALAQTQKPVVWKALLLTGIETELSLMCLKAIASDPQRGLKGVDVALEALESKLNRKWEPKQAEEKEGLRRNRKRLEEQRLEEKKRERRREEEKIRQEKAEKKREKRIRRDQNRRKQVAKMQHSARVFFFGRVLGSLGSKLLQNDITPI